MVKYPSVKEIFLVDIDEKVTELSKKYLPSLSCGSFNDKRLKLFHLDALKFVKRYREYFDIIIDDLTDPIGPSRALWSVAFYTDIKNALKQDGIAIFQTAYLGENFAKRSRETLRKIFPFFKMHKAYVGCFPFDEHTFLLGSKSVDFDVLTLEDVREKFKKLCLQTKYYSPEIHFASCVFPPSVVENNHVNS